MRKAGLNYIAKNGGVITDAVSRQKWPGAATVNVSIVNWVKNPEAPPKSFRLDGAEVQGISTRLVESSLPIEEFAPLAENRRCAFQGPIPAGDFYLSVEEAEAILARDDADYSDVVRPYLIGDDIAEDPLQGPRRYVIDFGMRQLEEAMEYPAALDVVRRQVKPDRDVNRDEGFRTHWWRFGRPRGEMRRVLAGRPRYIGLNRIGKRMLFVWCDARTCPSDLVIVFAFDDDYAMGVLSSSIHRAWALRESSTLEDRPRYMPSSAFDTFPWPPDPSDLRAEVGELAAAIVERRQEICVERQIGLTVLYNQVDEGAWRDLAGLHSELDKAVARAYGWPVKAAGDSHEAVARLARLHARIVAGEVEYRPFA